MESRFDLPKAIKPFMCGECALNESGKGFRSCSSTISTARMGIMLEELISERVEVMLWSWILSKAGLKRSEVFIDHTLRCLPPRNKQGKRYPVGSDRLLAESTCRQYDRLSQFKPDVLLLTLHPSALLSEIVPLPLIVRDMEKAVCFMRQGLKVLVLMGGKAGELFLGYGENAAKWRGTYELVSSTWYEELMERIRARGTKKAPKRKSKIEQLRAGGAAGNGGDVLEPPKRGRKKKIKEEVAL